MKKHKESKKAPAPKPGVLPLATKEQVKAQAKAELVMDVQGRTAIALAVSKDDEVKYIPMDSGGCYIYYMPLAKFRATYQHSQRDPASPPSLVGTDVEHAARSYITHMTYAGGGEEALEELGRLAVITSTERESIMKKNEAKKTAAASAPRVAGAGVTPPKTAGAKPKKEPKAPKAPKEKVLKPATTFRELIMKGGLTDDQIFAAVQKKHPDVGLGKRSYVTWYRNDLRKRGENPPAAKAEKPAK